jgi:hypothetical protein
MAHCKNKNCGGYNNRGALKRCRKCGSVICPSCGFPVPNESGKSRSQRNCPVCCADSSYIELLKE